MTDPLEALVVEDGDKVLLTAPGVGAFTCALPEGHAVVPGQAIGILTTLGRARELRVPAGVSGQITSVPHERVLAPVGYGEVLYELRALVGANLAVSHSQSAVHETGGLAVRAPQTGRFWRRTAPTDPPLASDGDVLSAGTPIGLIEVMKTFTHVTYTPGGSLPATATIARFAVEDGDEVAEGDPLAFVEGN